MRSLDFTPLMRSTVGFDHFANMLESVLDGGQHQVPSNAYPPYNIEKLDDNQYRITMAVAGFSRADLDIQVENNQLKVASKPKPVDDDNQKARHFLHRGIAERSFERHFKLADHIEVVGASMEHGLLHIDMVRNVPERLKPRTIEIYADETGKKSQKKLTKH